MADIDDSIAAIKAGEPDPTETAPPYPPADGRERITVILGCGRAITMRELTTSEVLDSREVASIERGDSNQDPIGATLERIQDREMLSRSIERVSDVVDWEKLVAPYEAAYNDALKAHEESKSKDPPPKFNIPAEDLLGTLKPEQWHEFKQIDFQTPGHAFSFERLFAKPADYAIALGHYRKLNLPTGKALLFVGKAQRTKAKQRS